MVEIVGHGDQIVSLLLDQPCSDDTSVFRKVVLDAGLVTAHSGESFYHADLELVQLDEENWDATSSN